MDKERLNYFRKKLLEERKTLLKRLNNESFMKEFGDMDYYGDELSNYDNHPADLGTELFFKEQDHGFKNKTRDTLLEVEKALDDIKSGSYGKCKECGSRIYEDRLDLIPYLTTCINCTDKRKVDDDSPEVSRQISSIKDEIGSSFSDTKETMVGTDREDSFQKVAQYNYVDKDPSFHTGDYLNVDDEEDHDGGDGVEPVENISQEYYDDTLK